MNSCGTMLLTSDFGFSHVGDALVGYSVRERELRVGVRGRLVEGGEGVSPFVATPFSMLGNDGSDYLFEYSSMYIVVLELQSHNMR